MFNNFVRLSSVIPKNVWNKILNIFNLFFAKESIKNHSQKLFWHLEAIEEALYLKRACYHIDQTIEYQFPTVFSDNLGISWKRLWNWFLLIVMETIIDLKKNLIVQLYKKKHPISQRNIYIWKRTCSIPQEDIYLGSLWRWNWLPKTHNYVNRLNMPWFWGGNV